MLLRYGSRRMVHVEINEIFFPPVEPWVKNLDIPTALGIPVSCTRFVYSTELINCHDDPRRIKLLALTTDDTIRSSSLPADGTTRSLMRIEWSTVTDTDNIYIFTAAQGSDQKKNGELTRDHALTTKHRLLVRKGSRMAHWVANSGYSRDSQYSRKFPVYSHYYPFSLETFQHIIMLDYYTTLYYS